MTHIWSPTLFPRGIITFQGVLTGLSKNDFGVILQTLTHA